MFLEVLHIFDNRNKSISPHRQLISSCLLHLKAACFAHKLKENNLNFEYF